VDKPRFSAANHNGIPHDKRAMDRDITMHQIVFHQNFRPLPPWSSFRAMSAVNSSSGKLGRSASTVERRESQTMATASSINELVQRRQETGLAKQERFEFASIEEAVRDLKAGRMIVVIDDEDRENEGRVVEALSH
jgi:hypothetical protein